MISTIKDLDYKTVAELVNEKGLILINPKHKDKALKIVKEWIFKTSAKHYSDLTDEEIDTLTDFFLEKPRTLEEAQTQEGVNKMVKAQSEMAKEGKYLLQYRGVNWLNKTIIITV
ncbi:MAG: hypothetical protein U9O94_01805 [Nanoarchaeota archaeon]|nr:hypothetical protein [Nanoarchaeota archaeon]